MQDSLEDYLRISNNQKDKEADVSKKIRADILITAQRKKECEIQAMKVVQLFIEGQLHPPVFLHCLKNLNPELYQDVVEERAIIKQCGYAICGRKIPEMPKKQFHISIKANKVYDITERKNFCSNFCYKASMHIKNQLDASPLWLRNPQDAPKFKLLPATTLGVPGELVDHGFAKPVEEQKFTSISSFAQLTLNEVHLEVKKPDNKNETESFTKFKVSCDQNMSCIFEEDESKEEILEEMPEEVEGNYRIGSIVKKTGIKHSLGKDVSKVANKLMKLTIEEMEEIEYEKANTENNENTEFNETNESISNNENKTGLKNYDTSNKTEFTNTEKLNNTKFIKEKTADSNDTECNNIQQIERSSKTKQKRSLEEIISRHRAIKLANNKGIKTIDLNELKSNIQSTSGKSNKNHTNIAIKNNSKTVLNRNENLKQTTSNGPNEIKICENAIKHDESVYDDTYTKIFENLKQWLTIDTFIFLYGEDKVKQTLNDKKLIEYFEKFKITELQTNQQIKYMEICKRLQMKELAEEQIDQQILSKRLQPLPDYKQLKRENEDLTLKVKSFYCGVVFEKPDTNFSSTNKKAEDQEEGPPAVLPLVDASSQNAMRRKVFLRSIHRKLIGHLDSLKLDSSLLLEEVQELVKTFKLSAKNVIFKPVVWNYVALVLIKIVSLRNDAFKTQIESEESQKYFQDTMGQLLNYNGFITDVAKLLENLDDFVKRFIISSE